jgi:hypothetical protein
MNAPRLKSLPRWGETIRFEVIRSGAFLGVHYRRGDVLVCGGEPEEGSSVVMVPMGVGYPRLGEVVSEGLRGDLGEWCHPVRWRAAGTILRVVRRTGTLPRGRARQVNTWAKASRRAPVAASPTARPEAHQLTLFAA